MQMFVRSKIQLYLKRFNVYFDFEQFAYWRLGPYLFSIDSHETYVHFTVKVFVTEEQTPRPSHTGVIKNRLYHGDILLLLHLLKYQKTWYILI